MTLDPLETLTLDAFLLALTQHPDRLPPDLQTQLNQIDPTDPQQINQLPTLAAADPQLRQNYETARQILQSKERPRTKGFPPQPPPPDQDKKNTFLRNSAVQIFAATDSVATAKTEQSKHPGLPFLRRFFN